MVDVVSCVAASDGVAVAPCGTVEGVAMVPLVIQLPGYAPLDYSQSGQLFAWAVSLPLIAFIIGLVIGSMIRVIRGA